MVNDDVRGSVTLRRMKHEQAATSAAAEQRSATTRSRGGTASRGTVARQRAKASSGQIVNSSADGWVSPNDDGVVLYACPELADWLELTLDADFAACLGPESELGIDEREGQVGPASAEPQSEQDDDRDDQREEDAGIEDDDDDDPDSVDASVDLTDDLDALRQSLDLMTLDKQNEARVEAGPPEPEPLVYEWKALNNTACHDV
jgi:hypothetical protein